MSEGRPSSLHRSLFRASAYGQAVGHFSKEYLRSSSAGLATALTLVIREKKDGKHCHQLRVGRISPSKLGATTQVPGRRIPAE